MGVLDAPPHGDAVTKKVEFSRRDGQARAHLPLSTRGAALQAALRTVSNVPTSAGGPSCLLARRPWLRTRRARPLGQRLGAPPRPRSLISRTARVSSTRDSAIDNMAYI